MNYRAKIALFAVFFVSITSQAQDIHFSQFYNSPLNLNPALAGNFDGNYRFAGNYRNQWNSVTIPFSTFSMSADAKNIFGKNNVGAGVIFNNDNTGDSRFRTTVFNVVGSYGIPFKKDSSQRITVGVQTGITNKNLSYDELRFDAQYNGISYVDGLPNRESFISTSQNFFNLHAGITYDNQIGERKKLSVGVSLFNITKPKESYFNNQAIRVDRRFSGFASYQFPVHDKVDIIPAMFYMHQGKYFEYIVGGRGKYILSEAVGANQAAYLGVFFRTKDAGFVTAEYDYNNWHFGLSYDINLSTLKQASNGRGGIELSAIYILKLFKPSRHKHIICPDYI